MVVASRVNMDHIDERERARGPQPAVPASNLSVVLFGMSGVFSARPLAALLAAGIAVRAFVLPALTAGTPPIRALPAQTIPRHPLPLLDPASSSPRQMAAARGIPVYEAADLAASETLAAIGTLAPDAICVACFPRRLPAELLRLPRLGALNVHPSLLPANRGPDPLFWTFYHGDDMTGVTVHLMDETLDTGPVLAQEAIMLPEGISEARLERICAEVGGRLLVGGLRSLADGIARPQPQDEACATHFGFSQPANYTLSPQWPASRAYRFVQGISGRGVPITVEVAGRRFQVLGAMGYEAQARQTEPLRLEGDALTLRCAPGVLYARVVERKDDGDGS